MFEQETAAARLFPETHRYDGFPPGLGAPVPGEDEEVRRNNCQVLSKTFVHGSITVTECYRKGAAGPGVNLCLQPRPCLDQSQTISALPLVQSRTKTIGIPVPGKICQSERLRR